MSGGDAGRQPVDAVGAAGAPAGGWGTSVRNLADLVRRAAVARPDHPAVVSAAGSQTWGEFDAAVQALAAGLRGLGLEPGDRIGLVLGNVPAFPLAFFAALRAGLVAVPVNTTYTRPERAHLLGDSGARVVIGGRRDAAELLELAAELPALAHVVVAGVDAAPEGALALDDVAGPPSAGERAAGEPPSGGEDLAVVVYTSGTSGRPRGAMLTHRALVANLEQGAAVEPMTVEADDVVLLVLPLFHIYGLNAGLGMAVFRGATSVLAERFDPVDTLALLARHRVSVVIGAPPMYVAWSMLPDVESAFATVRLATSGAAPLPAAVLQRVLEVTGHHVFEGYGLTETAPVLTTTLRSEVAKPNSIGRPLPGVELRLVDADGRPIDGGADGGGDPDDPDDPDEGGVGEIEVRGANLFSGYWPDGAGGPSADGWWRTGDVAYADADGDLHLVDRRRELILVSGFNVYPREVEDVLLRHPDIEEAAVIGIPHPYTGESVKALVVAVPGARLSVEEVIEWAARSLARFKCPTAVEFVPELPHSATGKISKGRLREIAAAAGPG